MDEKINTTKKPRLYIVVEGEKKEIALLGDWNINTADFDMKDMSWSELFTVLKEKELQEKERSEKNKSEVTCQWYDCSAGFICPRCGEQLIADGANGEEECDCGVKYSLHWEIKINTTHKE